MTSRNNWFYWEAEVPNAVQAPGSDPTTGATGGPPVQPQGNAGANQPNPQDAEAPPEDDVTKDPAMPEMPEDKNNQDFEQWRKEFFELSIKGDTNEMMASIEAIRERDLDEVQNKFVEDNIQILFYRQNEMVIPATKQLRKLIKDDIDRTNPGTTVAQHLTAVLEEHGILQQNLIKMLGLYGWKGDTHRKFMGALLGAIQVGGGAKREDLIFTDEEYTINISTRVTSQFGEINLGAWALKEDDPSRYLTEPELDRLSEGSPEEKQTLRRRIIMESIAEKFQRRAFLVHVVKTDGTIYTIGFDLGTALLEAYKHGKVVVRGQKSETKEAMISDDGEIVSVIDYDILYIHETGEMDDDGKPEMVEVPFISRRDSVLYLTAEVQTVHAAAASMSGLFVREMPYGGNPSDIKVLMRCVPDMVELLGKRCLGNTVPLPQNVANMGGQPKEKKPTVGPMHKGASL